MSQSSKCFRKVLSLLLVAMTLWPLSASADLSVNAPAKAWVSVGETNSFLLQIQVVLLLVMSLLLSILMIKARSKSRKLEIDEARHRVIADYGGEIVMRVGLDGRLNYASPAICVALGMSPEEMLGQDCAGLVHEEDRLPFEVALKCVGRSPNGLSFVHRLRCQNGSYVWFESRCHLVHDPKTGEECEIIVVSQDVSRQRRAEIELEAANSRLHMLSRTDSLTGIPNKRWFDETTSNELLRAARSETPVSLLMIDIDHFDLFNDRFGYSKGDVCLQAVAGAVELAARRPGDFTARYNGGTFAAVLPDTDIAGAVLLAEKIRNAVQDLGIPYDDDGNLVTVSVGAACVMPGSADNHERLTAVAERALQNAKKAGRNAVRVAPVVSDDVNEHHRSTSTALPAF